MVDKIPPRRSGLARLKARLSDPERRSSLIPWAVAGLILLLLIPKVAPALYNLATTREDAEEEVVPVDVVVARPGALDETLPASGTLLANREVELSAEVAGIVTQLHINEGTQVAAGDLLARINDNDLQAERRGVEYEIEVMEEFAERQERLLREGGTTRDAYDQILMRINELRSRRENLLAQLERREIRAPFDGVVGLRHVDPGGYLTPSSPIATLQNLDSVRVDFSIPERYSASVGPGSVIRFTVPGSDSVFTGEVSAVEPRIDPRTRSARIRAVADNEGGILRPGAFANVELVLASQEGAIQIPSLALLPDAGEFSVMVVREGRAERRPVTLGLRSDTQVQITSGLEAGAMVIVNGLHRVREGSAILPRSDGTTSAP